jgi:putative DNA primase/helicase
MNWRSWLEAVCGNIRWRNNQGTCHCPLPGHGGQDKHPSFSVNAESGQFYCHKEGIGGGPYKLAELTNHPLPADPTRKSRISSARLILKTYDYTDATGKLIYQAVRLQPKDFRVRRPDPEHTGEWLWNLTDCEPFPYRLPALLAAIKAGETVFVVEGEKDADALAELGLAATTNHGGAGKWTLACSRHFAAGAKVVVIADNDRPGQDHAMNVARKLQDLGCDVCNLTLPDLPEKGDVFDWLRSGGNKAELLRLVQMQRAQAEFAFTDLGNAERFAAGYADQLRYCGDWKKWLYWDETHWRIDNTGETARKAAEVVRQILSLSATLPEEGKQKAMASFARRCESAARLGSLLALAQSQAQLAVTADAFDSDPWLFNTQNCMIDLKTNQALPHDPLRLVTKLSPIVYDPAATCPAWEAFLTRVLADRPELIRYLQKAAGYSLTGETGEQCLFLLYGQGANGKSTFLSTIMGILSSYARQLPMDALLAKTNHPIPNDIAALRGARFASAVEADDGSRMAESLVKQMTGQDKLTARFLHGEWFEFDAQFKLWLATNHKPVIRGCDEAIWRRMRLIPFTVTIPAAERDPHLGEKLRQEWPGILNWALAGCRLWREEGLTPPEDVLAATEEYRGEMDILGDFVAQCCVKNPFGAAVVAESYRVYERWCVNTAERPATKRTFVSRMRERGLKTRHGSGHVLVWDGLALKEPMPGNEVTTVA